MRNDFDIIILGGGLAGLTAAIHLLQNDLSVMLIEKNTYPKHKVCGEYVSNEVLPYLSQLGIDPIDQGAKNITDFQFTGLNDASLQIKLPLGGFGISRHALDLLLFKKAIELGLVFENNTVTDVTFGINDFEVAVKDKSFRAPYVFGAYGKRSTLDSTLSRNFIKTKSPGIS